MFCKECGKYSADKETKCVYCGGKLSNDVKYRKSSGNNRNFAWLGVIIALVSLLQILGVILILMPSLKNLFNSVRALWPVFNAASLSFSEKIGAFGLKALVVFLVAHVIILAVFCIMFSLFGGLIIVSKILKSRAKETFSTGWSIAFFIGSIVIILLFVILFFAGLMLLG